LEKFEAFAEILALFYCRANRKMITSNVLPKQHLRIFEAGWENNEKQLIKTNNKF